MVSTRERATTVRSGLLEAVIAVVSTLVGKHSRCLLYSLPVLIACLLAGQHGACAEAECQLDERQRQAVDALVNPGGWIGRDETDSRTVVAVSFLRKGIVDEMLVAHLAALTELRNLRIHGTGVTDGSLTNLRHLSRLTYLDVADSEVTDAGLAHVEHLTGLQYVVLDKTRITDAGLLAVGKLRGLKGLSLRETRITDAGLIQLQGLKELKYVLLGATQVTGAGLRNLRDSQLEWLELGCAPVTDEDLRFLECHRGIKRLDIRSTKITDDGLQHVATLRSLEDLNLRGTRVTDAGLDALRGLTELRVLDLFFSNVTAEGVEKLGKALPGCKIRWIESPIRAHRE